MSEKKTTRDFSSILDGSKTIAALDKEYLSRFSINRRRVKNALDSKDVPQLREISQYFYHTSGAYRRLVDYYGTLLTFDYLLFPMVEEEKLSEESFKNTYQRKKEYVRNSNIKETSSEMSKLIVRDGAYYGYERDLNGKISFQPLPAKFCRSRFKVMGVYTVEFNYEFFRNFVGDELKEIVEAFPEEMQAGFLKYLKDPRNEQWQLLSPEYARGHMLSDEIPLLSSIFLDLMDYEDAKELEKVRNGLEIYKVIVQKIPLDKENNLTFELPELKQFHTNLRKAVSNNNIDVITTPCDVEAVDLKDKVETMKDNVERARNTIYSTAGTSSILFTSASKGSSIGLEESIRVDENLMLPLLQQFERWYDQKLDYKNKRYKFKIMFPPITNRNREEMVQMYMSAASSGYPTKLLALCAMGIDQESSDYLLNFENVFLKLNEKMVPTKSAHTTPGGGDNETGAPEKDDDDLSDEGLRTREKDGG